MTPDDQKHKKLDYSEYLTPARLVVEVEGWAREKLYQLYGGLVNRTLTLHCGRHPTVASSVIEIGCGIGWVPTTLAWDVLYHGVDKHPPCIALSRERNGGTTRTFEQADIRTFQPAQLYDVVCCFAVLKHFGLHEWDAIFTRVLQCGRYAVFTLPVLPDAPPSQIDALDDGIDFPHVWIAQRRVLAVLARAGHRIVETGDLEGTAERWFITCSTEMIGEQVQPV